MRGGRSDGRANANADHDSQPLKPVFRPFGFSQSRTAAAAAAAARKAAYDSVTPATTAFLFLFPSIHHHLGYYYFYFFSQLCFSAGDHRHTPPLTGRCGICSRARSVEKENARVAAPSLLPHHASFLPPSISIRLYTHPSIPGTTVVYTHSYTTTRIRAGDSGRSAVGPRSRGRRRRQKNFPKSKRESPPPSVPRRAGAENAGASPC